MSAQPVGTVPRWRFTVDDFERMGETGVLHDDDRVELLEGELYPMAPIGPTHAGIVNQLTRLLVRILGDRAVVAIQNPLLLAPWSEPQPDVVVARPRGDLYRRAHPTGADTLLVIEVAHSSLAIDRGIKVGLYARAGIVEYWLVDVDHQEIVVHRAPAGGAYTDQRTLHAGDRLTIAAMDDVGIDADAILGAP